MGGRKLFVEVANASNLMPKDGQGSANAYCVIEFDGQRQQTEVRHKDLNPSWNVVLEFTISEVQSIEAQVLHITLFNTKRPAQREPSFLGRVRIRGANFSKLGEEALVYYKLKRRSLLSQVKGEIGLKVWWIDEPDPPPPEEPPPTEAPPPEAAPPAEAEPAPAPATEAAPEAAAPPPEPTPEAVQPAEPTPEAPPVDPSAEPAPPAPESSPPEAPASEAPPSEPAAVEAEATPAPAAAEEAKPPEEEKNAEEEKKEEEAVKDTREDERIEVIEKAMMMKLQPVYWDHNQPYACEVPWNNFIVSSFLDNPYVNLPLQEECCYCCH